MKLFYSLLALCMLLSNVLPAQNINWAFNTGGTLTNTNDIEETGVFVLNDGSGNMINIGNFKGTTDMDPSGAVASLTSASSDQISTYIAKYDANKNLLWAKKLDNVSAFGLQDACVDKAGNFYIAGMVTQNTNFDLNGGSAIFTYSSTLDASNYFIAKYTTNGTLVWVNNFPGASKLTTDNLNNIYIYGAIYASTDIDVTAGVHTISPTGSSAGYFAKYDASLNFLMAQKIERGNANSFSTIDAITTDNTNIYIAGDYAGTVDFDPSAATANIAITPTGVQHEDPYFAKYDGTSGLMIWANSIVSNGEHAFIHATADASGNFYIMGFTNSTTMDFDPSVSGVTSKTGSGGSDSYLAKYSTGGALLWVNYFKAMNDFSFVLSPQHLYLHAMAGPSLNLDPNGSTPYYINNLNNFIGSYNLATGSLEWASAIGGSNQVTLSPELLYTYGGHSIAVDAQENVYATGCYYPVPGNAVTTSDFDPTPNVYPLTLNGDRTDSYLVKYSPLKLDFTTNKAAYCQGETMTIIFNPFGYYPAGNQYTFLLSDASGSFAAPVTLSTQTTSVAGSFTYVIPVNTAAGTGYKIRMTASNPSTVPVVEKSITINGLPATPVISGSSSVCGNAQNKTYSITAHAGSTYAWTPPANSTINGSSTNQQVVLNFSSYVTSGNVLVTETDALGCGSAQASFSISPLAVPALPTISGSASVCGNATNKSYTVTNTAGSTYNWNFPATATNSAVVNSNSITLAFSSFTGTGTISVAESNSIGCTGPTASLTVNALVVPVTSTIAGASSVCANAGTKSYTVTATSGSTYAWSVNGNASISLGQGSHSVVISYTNFTGGGVSVTETNAAGCVGTPVSLVVTGLATPITSSINGAASLCGNATLAPYSVTAHAGNTYVWSFPSQINIASGAGTNAVSVTASAYVTGASATVTETNTSSGCSGLPVSLFITPLAVPSNTITGPASICGNAKGVNYSVPFTTGSVYSWTPLPGASVVGSSTQNAIQFDCSNFTTGFTLKVHETTAEGCTGPDATLNLTPLVVPPARNITGPPVACGYGSTVVYTSNNFPVNSTYLWTLPSNAVPETTLDQYYTKFHFTDSLGGVLKMKETINGCSYDNYFTVAAKPVAFITGPATVCGQPVASYTYSTPSIPGATYYWSFTSQATAQGVVTNPSVQLSFSNYQNPSDINVNVRLLGCVVNAYYTVTPKTSPNLPAISGTYYTCATANNPNAQYKPDHANTGYRYSWASTANMPIVTEDGSTHTVDINVSALAVQYTTGVLTMIETDLSDNCAVATVKKTISGYPYIPLLSSPRQNICDINKNYTYSVYNPTATSTYNWTAGQNATIVSGNGTSTASVHFNAASTAQFSIVETNTLGCTTTPYTFSVNYKTSQYSITNQQVSCAKSSFSLPIAKNNFEIGLSKIEINLTYNALYASLATVNPYSLYGSVMTSATTRPAVSVTEPTPGHVKITITAAAGTYMYYGGNIIDIHFDVNHNNMQVGDVNTFASSSILETYLDGSVESCNTVSGTVTKIATSTSLQGVLAYSNTYVKLGYNSAQPSQYLITNISGTSASDCSGLSSPLTPDINGNFTYDVSNGNNLNISRNIPLSTDVMNYINGQDAMKTYQVIHGVSDPGNPSYSPISIYTLLSSDVNRDGKITDADQIQISNRATGNIHQFTTDDASKTPTPGWNFIDENTLYYSASYMNALYSYLSITNRGLIFDATKTLPIIPSCLPIRFITNGSCAEPVAEIYHGILMGDVEIPTNPGSTGRFNNAPGSNMRTQYTVENNATVFFDLSDAVQLPDNKVRFPLYFFAADTAQSLDVQLDYDQTKLKIDSVEHSTEEINEDFIFSYNDYNHDVLKISGFGPERLLSNVTLLYVTATLLDGNLTKTMLGDFGITLINGNPAQGQIVEATATAIVESEALKNVRLFPNPTTSQLNLTGLENVQSSVTIVNALGVPLTGEYINSNNIDVSNLAAGLYYVKISVDGSDKMIRFIKL